jgi:hypothetical protein
VVKREQESPVCQLERSYVSKVHGPRGPWTLIRSSQAVSFRFPFSMISHFVHDTQSVRIHDSVVVSRGTSKCHTTLDSSNDILAASELPPPGPDHYAAQRKLWLTPRHAVVSSPPESSTSRQRLEKLLSSPGAAESDDVWDNGIEKVWKGLNAGGRFKRRLPMALIVCP